MVFAFTETEKAQIESRGMMVIEFKRALNRIWCGIGAIFHTLSEALKAVGNILQIFAEKFADVLDDMKLSIEEIREKSGYLPSHRYKTVKILSKCTGIEKRSIWKMTRHTPLARSDC